jgi:hypothetical protein
MAGTAPCKPLDVVTTNSFDARSVVIQWDQYTPECTGGWPILGCTVSVRTRNQVSNDFTNFYDVTSQCNEVNPWNTVVEPTFITRYTRTRVDGTIEEINPSNVVQIGDIPFVIENNVYYPVTSEQVLVDNGSSFNGGNNGSWFENPNQDYVMPNTCTVSLQMLTQTPFSLLPSDGVYARVMCRNIINNSVFSDIDNGALIPSAPDTPQCSLLSKT